MYRVFTAYGLILRCCMIFLFLLPGYLMVNLYISFRITYWFRNLWKKLDRRGFTVTVSVLYFALALSPIFAFLLPKSGFSIAVRRLSAYWMGIMLYFVSMLLIAELARLILLRTKFRNSKLFSRAGAVLVGAAVFVSAGAVCLYGAYNARQIKTTKYELTVEKEADGLDKLRAVLIADTHMGYAIGRDHIREMVEKINAEEPDIVIFAGDIFDNSTEGLDYPDETAELFRSIKTRYGVWATYGNHDIDEQILMGFTFNWSDSPPNDSRMRSFCEKAGINLLCDETVLIDGKFYLVGRRDGMKPGTDDGSRLSPAELTKDLDLSKPVFFIAHEPGELQETADAGADIDFSGHTHDGQLFPLTIITDITWENACGVIRKDDMYSVVTSGVGVFGPFMRVGTDAEIVSADIRFSGKGSDD